jgi:carbon-monoxide dehydrogenase catalytic subunit
MLQLFGEIADLLGRDIPALPLVAAAPEWATEKALAIALYFAATGLPVQNWPPPPISGSQRVVSILTEEMEGIFGGYFFVWRSLKLPRPSWWRSSRRGDGNSEEGIYN